MSNDIRVSQPNSNSLYDALSFKTEKTTAPVEDSQQEVTEIATQDQTETDQPVRGRVPANNISFDDGPVMEQDPQQAQTMDDGALPSMEDLDNIQPQQQQEMQEPQQNEDELPSLNDLSNANNEIPEDYKAETSKDHSVNKAVAHLEANLLKKGLTNLATNYVKRTTTKAVTKELTEVLSKVVVGKGTAKAGADLAGKITAGTAKGLEKTVVDLTTKGLLGKGVATIGVKEGAREAGNLVKGLEAASKASGEILLQGGVKKVLPNTVNALAKTSVGAGEKVLQKGLQEGTEAALKSVLKNVAPETVGKLATETVAKTTAKSGAKAVVKATTKAGVKAGTKTAAKTTTTAASKAIEKVSAEAVTKATTEVAAKGGVKFATKVGKAMPYVGAAIGVGITVWDAKDAIEKTKDKDASTASKVFAWTTVGLDVVSTATTATGKGAPIGWAATGLSIGTSILSDYTR